ncbi:ParB/RepB/Spo0J family partition protein [Micromonospora sp. C95]|uniref:ParB/RepB/Spo0J family partition protein n=1 Tax=Micromonospora sp. C95 TaxID=2824882 RepID=UPI001B374C54|nr:ParB/RepB/Spo0J family partition protein [Micromonospora sp. C95]MBQ1023095.1 ParB/RepB/Spo0J family partition protein [Micromonospora sp. C95]
MKNRPRGGLGRGLGALIPTGPAPDAGAAVGASTAGVSGSTAVVTPAPLPVPSPTIEPDEMLSPVPGARFAEIPVDSIVPNPKQPRQVFDEEALEELKTSIQEVGFLQPIVVRQLDGEKFELVMGERRWRAAQAVGRDNIPAIVRDTRDDAMLRDALLENIHRANLNPLEEAAAYQQLLEEFGATHEELARRIGRSRPQISNTIRLMNLPAPVQRRVAAGVLSAGHARALLSLEDPETQEQLALRIVAEGLSVRATEEIVALALNDGPGKKESAKRRPKPHAPALTDLADRLSDRFDTRVKVDIGRSKGKITIEFATVDDLERIVGIIGVEREDPED